MEKTTIELLRSSAKLSQSQFAKRIGVSRQLISAIEKGDNSLTEKIALEIVEQFPNVSISWLLGQDDIMLTRGKYVEHAAYKEINEETTKYTNELEALKEEINRLHAEHALSIAQKEAVIEELRRMVSELMQRR